MRGSLEDGVVTFDALLCRVLPLNDLCLSALLKTVWLLTTEEITIIKLSLTGRETPNGDTFLSSLK